MPAPIQINYSSQQLSDINVIEVREGWKMYYLFLNAVWIVMYLISFLSPRYRDETVDFFFGKWQFAKLPFLLAFVLGPCLGLLYLFDRRVKVRVDSEGIWSGRKGLFRWQQIVLFRSTVYKDRRNGDLCKLYLTPINADGLLGDEVLLRFQRMDKEFDKIRPVVEFYAKKYNIEDWGHGNEEN